MRILEKLKKLGDENNEQLLSNSNIEKYVQDEICALLDAETPIREWCMKRDKTSTTKEYELVLDNINAMNHMHYSGSVLEGAMMARCFQNNENWEEIETDIMKNMFTIPQKVSHILEPVEDKPGFVCLPFCQELFSDNDAYLRYCVLIWCKGSDSLDQMPQYISPLVIKSHMKDFFRYMLRNFEIRVSLTETTLQGACQIPDFGHISCDVVPSVHLLFWPHEAATWITRHRLWPPQDTIQSIVDKGCQVVPRSSPGGDVNKEWRLSFSIPKAILAQLCSKNQRQAHYFFKMFFYRYLKCVESLEPEGKKLDSYIIKTTMLWAYEELPPENPIWASLENSVQFLLFKLLGSLEAGFLSHYFIPEINLLERVDEDVRRNCIATIRRWQDNVLMSTPVDIQEKLEFIQAFAADC